MQPIKLMAHNDPTFAGSYIVHLRATGQMIALGRNPIRAAALRLLEEGLADDATSLQLAFADAGKEPLLATAGEAKR